MPRLGWHEPHVRLDPSVLEHGADHTFTAGSGFEIISVMVCTPLSRKLGLIFNCGLTSEEGVKRQERRGAALCSREANQKSVFSA